MYNEKKKNYLELNTVTINTCISLYKLSSKTTVRDVKLRCLIPRNIEPWIYPIE